jgi:hypothetical protein
VSISVLDVRDTLAHPHIRVPSRPPVATSPTAPRRMPVAVLAVGLIGIAEAVGLLAAGLTSLDGVLASATRPAGWVVAAGLLVLAGWIVLTAGGAAAIIDGAGRKLLVAVSCAEIGLIGMLSVVATLVPLTVALPAGLPLPGLLLMAFAVPVGKLLLAGTPAAVSWVAAGPRTRATRPDPVDSHRVLATLTLGVIAVALGALTFLAPVTDAGPNAPASSVAYQH